MAAPAGEDLPVAVAEPAMELADGGWFDAPIWVLSVQIMVLSFAAVGGGLAMLMPELQRFIVLKHGWMSNEDFIAAFTLGQAAPGPNFLYVSLIGYHLAGFAGAVIATLAVIVPPALLLWVVLRFGESRLSPRFQQAMREGLAPVAAGLMMSFGWVMCSTVDTNWRAVLLTLVAVALNLKTRINPVWLVLAGALLGVAGAVRN